MRLFIAADINNRSKKLIKKKLKLLKSEMNNDFKWLKKENWHLTLKFIGEASETDKNKLIKVLKNIKFKSKGQYINFDKIGAFPDLERAKVLYLALNKGEDVLKNIYKKLESEIVKYDFEKDNREYIPHLTLGRSKNEATAINDKFRAENFVNIYARIESITLYQSKLKREGPEYIKLFSI
ncbi:MAG: RNA 2',3'-cyclic phosphodiesterase [Bacillota bacterium]